MVDEEAVRGFLSAFEQAQSTRDFDQVAHLIHPDALFRFNDGDFRGLAEVRAAFERTWSLDVEESSYRVENVVVNNVDSATGVATFDWTWEGETDDGPFLVQGRGTTVVVDHDGSLKVLIEHLSR
ncbi:MAG: nuclear transport factor 2 family protein [Acidimicrobiia bacterium]|nr:nuclear transport factor 2 family protein [Acidimicrobiia bacterium]